MNYTEYTGKIKNPQEPTSASVRKVFDSSRESGAKEAWNNLSEYDKGVLISIGGDLASLIASFGGPNLLSVGADALGTATSIYGDIRAAKADDGKVSWRNDNADCKTGWCRFWNSEGMQITKNAGMNMLSLVPGLNAALKTTKLKGFANKVSKAFGLIAPILEGSGLFSGFKLAIEKMQSGEELTLDDVRTLIGATQAVIGVGRRGVASRKQALEENPTHKGMQLTRDISKNIALSYAAPYIQTAADITSGYRSLAPVAKSTLGAISVLFEATAKKFNTEESWLTALLEEGLSEKGLSKFDPDYVRALAGLMMVATQRGPVNVDGTVADKKRIDESMIRRNMTILSKNAFKTINLLNAIKFAPQEALKKIQANNSNLSEAEIQTAVKIETRTLLEKYYTELLQLLGKEVSKNILSDKGLEVLQHLQELDSDALPKTRDLTKEQAITYLKQIEKLEGDINKNLKEYPFVQIDIEKGSNIQQPKTINGDAYFKPYIQELKTSLLEYIHSKPVEGSFGYDFGKLEIARNNLNIAIKKYIANRQKRQNLYIHNGLVTSEKEHSAKQPIEMATSAFTHEFEPGKTTYPELYLMQLYPELFDVGDTQIIPEFNINRIFKQRGLTVIAKGYDATTGYGKSSINKDINSYIPSVLIRWLKAHQSFFPKFNLEDELNIVEDKRILTTQNAKNQINPDDWEIAQVQGADGQIKDLVTTFSSEKSTGFVPNRKNKLNSGVDAGGHQIVLYVLQSKTDPNQKIVAWRRMDIQKYTPDDMSAHNTLKDFRKQLENVELGEGYTIGAYIDAYIAKYGRNGELDLKQTDELISILQQKAQASNPDVKKQLEAIIKKVKITNTTAPAVSSQLPPFIAVTPMMRLEGNELNTIFYGQNHISEALPKNSKKVTGAKQQQIAELIRARVLNEESALRTNLLFDGTVATTKHTDLLNQRSLHEELLPEFPTIDKIQSSDDLQALLIKGLEQFKEASKASNLDNLRENIYDAVHQGIKDIIKNIPEELAFKDTTRKGKDTVSGFNLFRKPDLQNFLYNAITEKLKEAPIPEDKRGRINKEIMNLINKEIDNMQNSKGQYDAINTLNTLETKITNKIQNLIKSSLPAPKQNDQLFLSKFQKQFKEALQRLQAGPMIHYTPTEFEQKFISQEIGPNGKMQYVFTDWLTGEKQYADNLSDFLTGENSVYAFYSPNRFKQRGAVNFKKEVDAIIQAYKQNPEILDFANKKLRYLLLGKNVSSTFKTGGSIEMYILDENNNLLQIPDNLTEEQLSGKEPFRYNSKKYYMLKNGGCISNGTKLKMENEIIKAAEGWKAQLMSEMGLNENFSFADLLKAKQTPTWKAVFGDENTYAAMLTPKETVEKTSSPTTNFYEDEMQETPEIQSSAPTVMDPFEESANSEEYDNTEELPEVDPLIESVVRQMPIQHGVGAKLHASYSQMNPIMQGLLDLFVEEKIPVRVTSGYSTSGHTAGSNHYKGMAFDVVPAAGYTYASIQHAIKNSPRIVSYMRQHNLGYINETGNNNPGVKRTGDNFHFGPDPGAIKDFNKLMNS